MNSCRIRTLPLRRNNEAIKQMYRMEVLGLPGPIDRWLTTNEHAGNITFLSNYIYLHNLTHVENVVCCVERQCDKAVQDDTDFVNPPTYTLYLTCMIMSLKVPVKYRRSPRAFLDRYTGFPEELTAPDWVGWEKPTLDFYQPRAIMAETFARLSHIWENWRQPDLQVHMLEWAKAVSIDLWPIPQVPKHRSILENRENQATSGLELIAEVMLK